MEVVRIKGKKLLDIWILHPWKLISMDKGFYQVLLNDNEEENGIRR